MAESEWILHSKTFYVEVYEQGEVRDWGVLYFRVDDPDYGAEEYKMQSGWFPFGVFPDWGEFDVLYYDTKYKCYRWDGWYRDVPRHLPYDEFDGWYWPGTDEIFGKAWLTGLDRWLVFYGEGIHFNW
jgi:hypothetical protein